MIPMPLSAGVPQLQALQPVQSVINSFWQVEHVQEHLTNLQDTIDLLRAMQKELKFLLITRLRENNAEEVNSSCDNFSGRSSLLSLDDSILKEIFKCSGNDMHLQFSGMVKAKRISFDVQESLSLEAANSLLSTLKNQLMPLNVFTSQLGSWEEKSMAVRLAQKLRKSRRNKCWKKKKKRHVAELLCKEREDYSKADKEADEWRTREIAKGIARRKVENMKAIAKLKANEEKKRLETELELVLVVEKLQELRSIRIQKLKKQGHFLPEEDDKFLERVRAAVEEEERQAAAAADTDAAKDAIATAEESRKAIHSSSTEVKDTIQTKGEPTRNQDGFSEVASEKCSVMDADLQSERQDLEGQGCGMGYDFVANLPPEFYHYYHGSNNDMGTLIEVRRMWDAYIRPGGSRIPGHWVWPPPPADDVWASYLVSRK